MKIPSGVRYFNKYILNKLTGKIAQAGWGPFAILYHVGRKSGKHYETPIWVFPSQGGFMIALNLRAECRLVSECLRGRKMRPAVPSQ